MIGAVVIVFFLLIVLPVTFLMLGGVLSAIIGYVLKRNAEQEHEGSELIDLYY